MNLRLAEDVIATLNKFGVNEYIVAAGARNAPMVKALSAETGLQVSHYYDERGAAFFALGRARLSKRPVAVVTTSGTAAAELLPAAVEAFYSRVPLVLITADRPPEYRGTGAPQAIEQVGLFSHYAQTYDISTAERDLEFSVSADRPTHLNICFREPLLDEKGPKEDAQRSNAAFMTRSMSASAGANLSARDFFGRVKKPVVIVGELELEQALRLKPALMRLGAPVYLEAHSQLREDKELASIRLNSGPRFFSNKMFRDQVDGVIRIGGVPTVRFWRDLEDLPEIQVLSVSDKPFSGLARETAEPASIAELIEEIRPVSDHTCAWLEMDRQRTAGLDKILGENMKSEAAWFRRLSEIIPAESFVFIGNSLPIREWDLAATRDHKRFTVAGNRGANGIDGLLATFFGMVKPGVENWLVLGDLSALYDLNSLSMLSAPEFQLGREAGPLRVVVVNNGGGKIFSRMFHDKKFENRHEFSFAKWAEMFGWDYAKWTSAENVSAPTADERMVIEIVPDNVQSENFWKAYEGL